MPGLIGLWLGAVALLSLSISVTAQEAWLDAVAIQPLTTFPCTRLLNASAVIGCQSYGATGVLHGLETQEELDAFASAGGQGGYAVVLPIVLYTRRNLEILRDSGRISGVVVVPGPNPPRSYSGDIDCPNCAYTQYRNGSWGTYDWNPRGTGLNFESWDFPVFASWPVGTVSNNSLEAIKQAVISNAQKKYSSYPLYAVDFDALMYAAVNSPTCLRRGFCDPVGGYSVWSTPKPAVLPDSPIVLIAATLDAASLFHDLASGLDTHFGGMIANMLTADALSRSPIPASSFNGTILFGFFNAEQWAHAGSQRFARDITSFTCLSTSGTSCPLTNGQCKDPCIGNLDFTNISISRIAAIIELNQLGTGGDTVYAHLDVVDNPTRGLLERLNASTAGLPVRLRNPVGSGRLPPCASLAFLERRQIPAVVLTNFNAEFATEHYNSELDSPPFVQPSFDMICSTATIASRTAWRLAQGLPADAPVPAEINANCTLAAELLECFTANFSCPLTQPFLSTNGVTFVSSYAGVFNFGSPMPIVHVVNQFMKQRVASAFGPACNRTADCSSLPGAECVAKQCLVTLSRLHQAFGTGLEFNSGSGQFQVTDGTRGTWTESRWTRTVLRVFQTNSMTFQIGELVGGIAMFGAAVGGWFGGRGYSKKRLGG